MNMNVNIKLRKQKINKQKMQCNYIFMRTSKTKNIVQQVEKKMRENT